MAYQRFDDDSDFYIWSSVDGSLNVWITHKPTTKTVEVDNGAVSIKYTNENLEEATTLFRALYDHLISNGTIIDIDKKRKQLKLRKGRRNARV